MAHFKRWLWPAADGQLVLTARTHRGPSIATLLKDIILPVQASFRVQTTEADERHLRPLRSAQPVSCMYTSEVCPHASPGTDVRGTVRGQARPNRMHTVEQTLQTKSLKSSCCGW
jgi:hypothetical protein